MKIDPELKPSAIDDSVESRQRPQDVLHFFNQPAITALSAEVIDNTYGASEKLVIESLRTSLGEVITILNKWGVRI